MQYLRDKFWFYMLSVKYFLQGDDWDNAEAYAKRLVYGFKKHKKTDHNARGN